MTKSSKGKPRLERGVIGVRQTRIGMNNRAARRAAAKKAKKA